MDLGYALCPRCGGSGHLPQYDHVQGGVCFCCDGSGNRPHKLATNKQWYKLGKLARQHHKTPLDALRAVGCPTTDPDQVPRHLMSRAITMMTDVSKRTQLIIDQDPEPVPEPTPELDPAPEPVPEPVPEPLPAFDPEADRLYVEFLQRRPVMLLGYQIEQSRAAAYHAGLDADSAINAANQHLQGQMRRLEAEWRIAHEQRALLAAMQFPPDQDQPGGGFVYPAQGYTAPPPVIMDTPMPSPKPVAVAAKPTTPPPVPRVMRKSRQEADRLRALAQLNSLKKAWARSYDTAIEVAIGIHLIADEKHLPLDILFAPTKIEQALVARMIRIMIEYGLVAEAACYQWYGKDFFLAEYPRLRKFDPSQYRNPLMYVFLGRSDTPRRATRRKGGKA